jgi:hypothetical protein
MNVPALGRTLIALAAPEHLREEIAGDLQERFRRAAFADGTRAARRMYWTDLWATMRSLCLHNLMTTVRVRWRSSLAFGCIVYVLAFTILTLVTPIAPRDAMRFVSPAVVLLILNAVPTRAPRAVAGAAFVGIVLVVGLLQFVHAPRQNELFTPRLYVHYLQCGAMIWGMLAASVLARKLVMLRLSLGRHA